MPPLCLLKSSPRQLSMLERRSEPLPSFPGGERRAGLTARVGCALILLGFGADSLQADEAVTVYRDPHPNVEKLEPSEWTLHPFERERTANALAAYVVNVLWTSDGPDKASWAARFIGLALAIHRENPRANVTNRLLRSGENLKPIEMEFSPGIFARILYNRAVQLREGSEADKILAAYFMAVAAQIDPYFEDAVYAHEVARFDGKAPDWSVVTGWEETTAKRLPEGEG